MNNNFLQDNNMIRYAHPNLAIFCAWWIRICDTASIPCILLSLLILLPFNSHLLTWIFAWPMLIVGGMGLIHFFILSPLVRCDKCNE